MPFLSRYGTDRQTQWAGVLDQMPFQIFFALRFAVGRCVALFLSIVLGFSGRVDAADPDARQQNFDTRIAPLLASRCLSCHNGLEKKGGLDLSQSKAAFAGGDSGKVLEAGKPDASLLWEKISTDEMPPKKPLKAEEKALLREWIQDGMHWGQDPIDSFKFTTDGRAGYDWWSLKPVVRPALPPVKASHWPRNAIDHFIAAKLESNGLSPAAEADRRTYIRRLSFDLLGLPPSIDEVNAFVADQSSDAYEKLVTRLLDSPAYGERWARHWLDVVRFGESQGFERDRLRPNSWRYRDWVVMALNRDLPYDKFVRQQLAGDVIAPDDPLSVIATGYLVAAPWDEVGQSQQSAAMRAVVRQDELEDVVGTTAQTFLGLTANCARCHDHKFDPISQREYYQLAAALGGVRHGERESLSNPGRVGLQARVEELKSRRQPIAAAINALDAPVRERLKSVQPSPKSVPADLPVPIARWEFNGNLEDSLGSLHGVAQGNAQIENGHLILDGQQSFVATAAIKKPLREKTLEAWVKVPNLKQQGGGVMTLQKLDGSTFDSIVFGEREPSKWFPGSDGFSRSMDLVEAEPEQVADQFVHVAIVYQADLGVRAYRNGRPYGRPYQATAIATYETDKAQIVFGMRHAPAGGNRMLSGEIDRAQLYDRALTAQEIAASAGVIPPAVEITTEAIVAALSPSDSQRRNELVQQLTAVESELRLLSGGSTYAVTPRQPEATYLLLRGNPATRGEEVPPGGVKSIVAGTHEFLLPSDAPEAQRRIELAKWITDPQNPLTARVIVNRLWHYHFGTAFVDTPNDLGFNGSRPSHPELLDWLASELVQQGWSLKSIHRLIVLSATYRQSPAMNPEAMQRDADNRLLWRKTPMRLEAEALRDAVLEVSGELNSSMGGPGFQDFTTFTANSQFYEVIDPVGFAFQRRSLYRTWIRSGRNPLLDVLDCPDPSTTAPKRAVTTTPLQALALLNNSFLLRMADKLADRINSEGHETNSAKVTQAFERVLQRPPATNELTLSIKLVEEHGLPALARVLFNSNEFLYVD